MYSTIESVSKKIDQKSLIQLLNDEVRIDSAIDLESNDDVIVQRFNEASEESQAEIDSFIRGRYTLPFASTPKIILSLSDNLTIYHCYLRRYRDNMPESILSLRKEALKMLEQIQKGLIDIGIEDEPQNLSGELTTNKKESDRIFNKDMWRRY